MLGSLVPLANLFSASFLLHMEFHLHFDYKTILVVFFYCMKGMVDGDELN